MARRGKPLDKWLWIPSGDACDACKALAGEHTERPGKPHDNCKCDCIHMERQINPRGKKQPYQVGFRMNGESTKTGMDSFTVAVTCMRPLGAGGGDDDSDGEEEGGDEFEPGETHTGDIQVPSHEIGLDLASPEGIAESEANENLLHDYARALYENYCIGYA